MKQLVILSGKGGTGKTTVASSFIKLSNAKMYADCDVDAPNLHLLFKDGNTSLTDFYGLKKAVIHNENCILCRTCLKECKFSAIEEKNGKLQVNQYNCEGCGMCEYLCPCNAITLEDSKAGELKLNKSENKVFSTAELKMGSGTSGKLVTEVKKQLLKNQIDDSVAIIDGSPGIGCPVIATLSGADAVLIVTEPTISGFSDLERIINTALGFKVKVFVTVNKADINKENTEKIIEYLSKNNIEYVGSIPYDKEAVRLINEGKTVVDSDSNVGNAIREIYKKVMSYFGDKNENICTK